MTRGDPETSGAAVTADEPVPPPVEVVRITATGESEDGAVGLSVMFGVVSGPGVLDNRHLHHALKARIMGLLSISSLGASADGVQIQVRRERLEDAVRAIHRAVAEFNDARPSLAAEQRRDADRIEAEKAAQKERLKADQAVIDRLMEAAAGRG